MSNVWTSSRALAIAVGGATGAGARYWLLQVFGSVWPVLVANLVGSLVLGIAMGKEWSRPRRRTFLHDGVGIGFCGGLTTFSTLSLEVADYLRDGSIAIGVTYLLVSVGASIAAAAVGAFAMHRVHDLAAPLEEAP